MRRNLATENPRSLPLQPKHIDASKHFFDAFGRNETEVSAGCIIRFFQERGESWEPFTQDAINAFYSETDFWLHDDLLLNEWIKRDDQGNFHVTVEFIATCYRASPALLDTADTGS